MNVWQRGTACGLGGFIGIFISRQFSNDWLWTSIGLILGLFVGWMVAMFADNPKPFMHAVKDAFAEARKIMTMRSYDEAKPHITFIFWFVMGMLAVQSTCFGIFAATGSSISFIGMMIDVFFAIVLSVAAGVALTSASPVTEKDITNIKKLAYRGNLVGLTYYVIANFGNVAKFAQKFCVNVYYATKVFLAKMFLYFYGNAGLVILTNVALALGVGHYHGYVAGVAVGFISGAMGTAIYNKGQNRLRAMVAKSS